LASPPPPLFTRSELVVVMSEPETACPPIPVLPVAPPAVVVPLPMPEPELPVPAVDPVLPVDPELPVVPVPPDPALAFNVASTFWKLRLVTDALYVPLRNPFVHDVAAYDARGRPSPIPASSRPPTIKLF
jgi:hypothetical protein